MADGTKQKKGTKPTDGEEAPKGSPKEVGPWIFKSKYRDDQVRLKPPQIRVNVRGEKTVTPAVYAEFDRNTWTTEDPELARILREKIEERAKKNPLHVVETTAL